VQATGFLSLRKKTIDMTWRLFIDDERFPSSKDYDMIFEEDCICEE
jgi:hypothetical protein